MAKCTAMLAALAAELVRRKAKIEEERLAHTEIKPRQRTPQKEMRACQQLADHVTAATVALGELAAACGAQSAHPPSALPSAEEPASTGAGADAEVRALVSAPQTASAATPTGEVVPPWKRPQAPIPPFPKDRASTSADRALRNFNLLSIRDRYGNPIKYTPYTMTWMIYVIWNAVERQTGKGKYIDAQLRTEFAKLSADIYYELKSDSRLLHIMHNFRCKIAPLYKRLKRHVPQNRSGLKPIEYLPLPSPTAAEPT